MDVNSGPCLVPVTARAQLSAWHTDLHLARAGLAVKTARESVKAAIDLILSRRSSCWE
jgi:hypothetical protein